MNLRRCLPALLLGLVAQAFAQAPVPDAAVEQRSVLLMLRLPPAHYRPDATYGDGYAGAGHDARRRIARSLGRAQGLALREDWPMPALGVDCFVLLAPDAAAAARAADTLARDPRVESAQPMHLFHALADDPLAPAQPVVVRWRLDALHRVATGRGVRVAVIDSGVALAHPDLRGQVAEARNFVDAGPPPAEAHGTQVAGIIAARAGNGAGIVGVAPQARLLALRACWEARPGAPAMCSSFTLARALQHAIDAGPDVLSLSLAGPRDPLLARLLDVALRQGIAVVAATQAPGDFPAAHPGVIAVAASEAPVAGAWSAPGVGIPTTAPDGGWTLVTGASFAAAEVSGLVADLRQRAPRLRPPAVARALGNPPIGDPDAKSRDIDACAAIARAGDGACVCNCATASARMAAPHR